MDRLIAIVRTADNLKAIVSRPAGSFRAPLQELRAGDSGVDGLENFYQVVELPLAQLPRQLYPNRDLLLKAWRVLRVVADFDGGLLAHLLTVLLATRSETMSDIDLPALEFNIQEKLNRPTAAHPRAYQGTKYQPPKPKKPPVIDLIPYLNSSRDIKTMLTRLKQHWPAALEIMAAQGIKTGALAAIVEQATLTKTDLSSADPYFLAHHAFSGDIGSYKLPDKFSRYLLPLLSGLEWRALLDYLAIYRGLLLDQHNNLLFAIARLLSLDNSRNVFEWCRIIERQLPASRALFTALLINTRAYQVKIDAGSHEIFERFNQITPAEYYASRLLALMIGLRKRINIEYLMSGFELANLYDPDYKFEDLKDCRSYSHQVVINLIEYLKQSDKHYKWIVFRIWERCGQQKEFNKSLTSIEWQAFTADTARVYLEFYLVQYGNDPTPAEQKMWQTVFTLQPTITTFLNKLVQNQHQFIKLLKHFCWHWEDEPEKVKKYLPAIYQLASRLNKSFYAESNIEKTLSIMIGSSDDKLLDKIINAPESCFTHLERATRSENDNRLIGFSMFGLMKYLDQFTVKLFLTQPKTLFKVARLLGCLKRPLQYSVIKEFKQHQLMTTDLTSMPLADQISFIETMISADLTNPVPVKLSEYINGRYKMNTVRLEYYQQQFYQKLDLTRLEILEKLIVKSLRGEFRITDERVDFALQLFHEIDDNRRALKRFIKAYLNGDDDYLLKHPISQQWFKKHPVIDVALWTTGIKYRTHLEKYGEITIAVEQDPLEALKLGAYVGSCLSLGGMCSYSAAAVVLDVNKQVLYARDCNNRIIARQLVAISEDEQLICFQVYSPGNYREFQGIFRQYDEKFAELLGLNIYRSTDDDDDYDIENLLSTDWWNDYAWNLKKDVKQSADRFSRSTQSAD